MNRAFILAVLSAGMVTAAAAAKPNVDAERAARYFEEAQAISRRMVAVFGVCQSTAR